MVSFVTFALTYVAVDTISCTTRQSDISRVKQKDTFRPFKLIETWQLFIIGAEGEEETKYQCPDCGHYYSSIASLKVHLQLHDDSRTVAAVRCNHCSRYFSRQEDLDAHIRQLHVKLKRRRQGSSHLKSPAANEWLYSPSPFFLYKKIKAKGK